MKSILLIAVLFACRYWLVAVSPLPVAITVLLSAPALWAVADLVQPLDK